MASLLEKRLIFVTGKGGVGKSTVAAALGLIAARNGRRTIIAEVARQDRVSRAFDHQGEGFREVELADSLFAISIDPQRALEEYLVDQLRVRALAETLGSSRLFQYLAAATPGIREVATIGKVWELAQPARRTKGASPYDLVIVDGPATGHAIATLRSPRTFANVARAGPVARHGATIAAMVADGSQTGVIAVALGEEMPVNETLMLKAELARDPGLEIDHVVANEVYAQRFGDAEQPPLAAALRDQALDAQARAALLAALSEQARARGQRVQIERLAEAFGRRPSELPFVFAHRFDLEALQRLSGVLEEQL